MGVDRRTVHDATERHLTDAQLLQLTREVLRHELVRDEDREKLLTVASYQARRYLQAQKLREYRGRHGASWLRVFRSVSDAPHA